MSNYEQYFFIESFPKEIELNWLISTCPYDVTESKPILLGWVEQ